jgi:hypothetical protein
MFIAKKGRMRKCFLSYREKICPRKVPPEADKKEKIP